MLFHTVGLELENGVGFTPLKQFVGLRIVQRNLVDVDGKAVARYTYDGLRRRRSEITEQGSTRWVWSGQEIIAEFQGEGRTSAYISDDFEPLWQFQGLVPFAIICNISHVPSEVLNGDGAVVSQMRLDGLGRVALLAGTGPHSPFRLAGQYADPESNFYYNRFRYFDPSLGRFTSPDPIGLAGGLNDFIYADNTVNWQDPLGLKCKLVHFRIKANPKKGSLAQWKAKRDTFNSARKSANARVPTKADYDSRIRPAADREAAAARRGGGFSSKQDADHPGDVRATGLLGQTLEPRPSGVNRSFGSQIGKQAGGRTPGSRTPMADLVDGNGKIIR